MAKVMRKEARHTQRWDRASGVPLEILEHLPPSPEPAYLTILCSPGWPQLRSRLPFGPRSQASLQKAQGPGLCKLPKPPAAKRWEPRGFSRARVAQGVSGPSSSCVWNPRVFADDARGWQCPFVLCLHPQGCLRPGGLLRLDPTFAYVEPPSS